MYLNEHAQISRAVKLVCKQAAKEDFCICVNLKATRTSAEREMTDGEPKDDTVINDPKETDKEATPSSTWSPLCSLLRKHPRQRVSSKIKSILCFNPSQGSLSTFGCDLRDERGELSV